MTNKNQSKGLRVYTFKDALEMIRSHPDMYGCKVDNILKHLTHLLIKDARYLNVSAEIVERSDWNMVFSNHNWLKSNFKGVSEENLFYNKVVFPEAGINAMRSEILVNAFANNISLYKDSEIIQVKGIKPPDNVIELLNTQYKNCFAVLFNEEWSG